MSHQSVINDPNYVPLANHQGVTLCTHDGTIIIVSSTLRVRTQHSNQSWLKTPVRLSRGKR